MSGLAEAFGWFGYSMLEEMDMEEAIERLNERIDRLQTRVNNLEDLVLTMKEVLTENIQWDIEEHTKLDKFLEAFRDVIQSGRDL